MKGEVVGVEGMRAYLGAIGRVKGRDVAQLGRREFPDVGFRVYRSSHWSIDCRRPTTAIIMEKIDDFNLLDCGRPVVQTRGLDKEDLFPL